MSTVDDTPPGNGSGRDRVGRRIGAWTLTGLAGLLVLFVMVAPSGSLAPSGLVRIPIEGVLGVALLLVLPPRPRRIVVWVSGAALGLFGVVKIIDLGYVAAIGRPFDPLLDWSLFGPAFEFVADSYGSASAVGAAIGALLFAAAVLVFTTLAVRRLGRLVAEHRTGSARTATVLAVGWVVAAVLGVQLAPPVPIASAFTYDQVRHFQADLADQQVYAAQAAVDQFRDIPGTDLLTALRGKDVMVVFVESYGRVAVDDPALAPQIGAALDAGDQRLRAAGFGSRSGFLTSPTVSGISWLAHSTLQSGLWIDTLQRYADLTASDRFTLSAAFHRAGWRTVGVVPANTKDWPEGGFYGYDHIYDSRNLGYQGPPYSFASIPDQYTLSAFHRAERATSHAPVMAEIDLLSSHAPWEPVPRLLDWDAIGDGSVYDTPEGASDPAESVLSRDLTRVRTDYGRSIEYSLNTLMSYVETYGDDDLVLLFLGDHQPAPVVSGEGATRDVPISVIARDPAVLDRVARWGWSDGLSPDPHAPVWRMDAFRDRFLSAFSPQVE